MSMVEVGQYFVTRNANEFLLKSVACREYTLPRDDPASEAKGWIQGNIQQVNSLSPENRLNKFCKEAGFMSVVEVGQYFVTRNASEFVYTIACREYTLPRDGQGDGVPKACLEQAAADSRGSRTCVCVSTSWKGRWHTQGWKDELTSCRGTV